MDETCYLSNLTSQGSNGWRPQDQREPQFSSSLPEAGTTGTTSQEMTESKPESLNLLPNQGARMRPKWQTFHHLCCNGSGDLILSFIPIMGSHLVEWPKKGLIMLLTLSVSIHDNAYKGQCLLSPTLILHRHITFIPSWISAGLLSTLYLLHSISHTCQLLFLIRVL